MIQILNLISSLVKETYFLVIKLSLFANKNQASVTSYINMPFWTGIIECMFKKISSHVSLVVHDENHGIHIYNYNEIPQSTKMMRIKMIIQLNPNR